MKSDFYQALHQYYEHCIGKNEIDGEILFVDRIWTLEVSPSFSDSFCVVVYEGRKKSILAITALKKLHSEMAEEVRQKMEDSGFFNKNNLRKEFGQQIRKLEKHLSGNETEAFDRGSMELFGKAYFSKANIDISKYIFYRVLVDNTEWLTTLTQGFSCNHWLFEPDRSLDENCICLTFDGTRHNFNLQLQNQELHLNFNNSDLEKKCQKLFSGFAQAIDIIVKASGAEEITERTAPWTEQIQEQK